MDILSAIGFVLALVAVLVGAVLKGAGIHALLSAAAFMIVVVGTFAVDLHPDAAAGVQARHEPLLVGDQAAAAAGARN